MKTLVKTVSVVGLFAISGLAMADQCPDHLNADDTYDCIVGDAANDTNMPQAMPAHPEAFEAADQIDDSSQQQASADSKDSTI